jgi:putative membrane protein
MRIQTSIAICGVLCCFPLFAKSNTPQASRTPASDQEFLQNAAESDMLHAHLGQMAEKNSTTRGIRDLGQEISQNDQSDYQALSTLAGKIGETIPKGIDDQGDRTIQRISHLRGSAFDHAFINEIIDSDKKELAAFQHESQHAQNAEVKAYASNALPALKLHLYEAQDWVKYGDHKK